MNESDMPANVPEDQVAVADNVEFFYSSLGERRLGCMPIDITDSELQVGTVGVHLAENFPTNDITEPEYWGITANVDDSAFMGRYFAGAWSRVVPDDPIIASAPDIYHIRSQPLNGNMFFAYPNSGLTSEVDVTGRVHVWDGASLRRAGLRQPSEAPTAADEGSGAYPATVRYFRIRYIARNGTAVLRRSEPSASLAFTPSGSGAGATVTRPGLIDEGETDWELEASTDDAFYYTVQTIAASVTTATDTTDLSTQVYADEGPLSEDIGTYDLLPNARFLAADADRLLLGGHWTDQALQSRVMWTPVFSDPGAGNDERLPLSTGGDNFVDLDNYEGGALTAISQMSNGTWYAFKWSQIYRLTRTGDILHAYDPVCISKTRGALPESVTTGVDEAGRACLYFADPSIGPCMLGAAGLREITGLRSTWKRVNVNSGVIPCRVVYYPDKQQVIWWFAADSADTPNLGWKLQVNQMQAAEAGSVRGAWSLVSGVLATATSAAIWHETTEEEGVVRLRARPFIWLLARDEDHNLPTVQRCDCLDTDDDEPYCACLLSRPYYQAGIANFWGVMNVAILGTASLTAAVAIGLVRDFGIEETGETIDLVPTGFQTFTMRRIDNLDMSESQAIQFRVGDECCRTSDGLNTTTTNVSQPVCISPLDGVAILNGSVVDDSTGDTIQDGSIEFIVFDQDGIAVGVPIVGVISGGAAVVDYPLPPNAGL